MYIAVASIIANDYFSVDEPAVRALWWPSFPGITQPEQQEPLPPGSWGVPGSLQAVIPQPGPQQAILPAEWTLPGPDLPESAQSPG